MHRLHSNVIRPKKKAVRTVSPQPNETLLSIPRVSAGLLLFSHSHESITCAGSEPDQTMPGIASEARQNGRG